MFQANSILAVILVVTCLCLRLSVEAAFFVSKTTKQKCGCTTTFASASASAFSDDNESSPRVFGDLYRLQMPGCQDNTFVGTMGVPTFAASRHHNDLINIIDKTHQQQHARGLEGALGTSTDYHHGPAFVLPHVLCQDACESMIAECESVGFGNFDSGKNHHGAMQILVSPHMATAVAQALARHLNVNQVLERHEELQAQSETETSTTVRLFFSGVNRRWRIYRYDSSGSETFAPHTDCGFPPSGLSKDGTELIWDANSHDDDDDTMVVSRLTLLMYLNDDFEGGETKFYQPRQQQQCSNSSTLTLAASVKPRAGSCLIFPQVVGNDDAIMDYANQHWPLHEGSAVTSGKRPKYVIRSDLLFTTVSENSQQDDILFCHDEAVRKAFLPTSHNSPTAIHPLFFSHVSSLYNPHMGVEHLGPLLYSFVRFTKSRHIVEIGAGYTSLWILQALKENDDELTRIRQLQQDNKCRLLDTEWALPMQQQEKEPAKLLCVDNCLHQKETATDASAVAQALGLEDYLEFVIGDAFELNLDNTSVDVLWCDFGVGSRIQEFVASAWPCLRPGGFLLCHSTLTNSNTREWLDAIRARQPQNMTGIAPDEYVELSLLEPHKFFQNSISILQKRTSNNGETYEEPIYSQYA